MRDHSGQSVLFPEVFPKPITMKFNVDGQTSDGGALLLALAAPKIGLIEA